MSDKVVPLISSGTAGPLGAIHLPRLWVKLTLAAHGKLADGYDECGPGFDGMTLAAFNLDRAKTMEYVRSHKPTYMQFEEWVVAQNGGHIEKAAIEKHNAAVRGYNHGDDQGESMRKGCGIKNGAVKDAVTLNGVDDLDELHRHITKS